MSHALATFSPASSLRRIVARVWGDPDTRSTTIGLVGVLVVHLLLLVFGPRMLRLDHAPSVLRPHASGRDFKIEITPDTFTTVRAPEKAPPPKQYVETNPNAPENIPDKTNNFAAQNQQVAQEKPTPNGQSERPALEGKKDFQSNQIVSGSLQKQAEFVPPMTPAVETPPMPQGLQAPIAEQNPLPGFDKKEGDNPNAFGTNLAPTAPNPQAIPKKVDGIRDVPIVQGATGMQPAIDPKRPRPRPQIVKNVQTRPAILAENKIGTMNVGVTAINAKFNDYGAYLRRLCEAVQLEWDGLLSSSRTYPPQGTYVVVKFTLNSSGRIASFGNVDNHSSTWGAQACTAAISNRQPYGEWTDDMKAALNPDGEELVFTFYYQ